jgi:cell division septation protein DedD
MENGMDKKLKQRLLGVTVLVMLAVIIVPELVREPARQSEPVVAEAVQPQSDVQEGVTTISLPEPQPPPPGELAVTLPSTQAPNMSPDSSSILDGEGEIPMAFETPALEQTAMTSSEPEPEPEPELKAEPEPEPELKAEPEPEPEPELKAEPEPEPEPEPELKAEPKPKPKPKPVKKSEPKTAVASKDKPDAAPLPPITLVSRVGVESANAAAGTGNRRSWMVQAGSFSMIKNANRLKDRLRSRGFSAVVQRTVVADRTLYRVRIGPQSSRDGSEQVRNRLERDTGIRGNVIRSGG